MTTEQPYRKKLVETALPLEAINAACKADKDRKTGTIRNLHKWFAPMPVPALRALIFASLVDDPDDPSERDRLLRLVESLVSSTVDDPPTQVINEARSTILRSVHTMPLVLDPFCGGGSTLVEAQRLALPSRGSDLNPIPVLISKTLTEFPARLVDKPPIHPNVGRIVDTESGLDGFFHDVNYYAQKIRDLAWTEIGHLYPLSPNGDPVVTWRWARTVESPDPRFQGAMVPLVSNWWLSKRAGLSAFIEPIVDRERHQITFAIASEGSPPPAGKGTCLFSATPIPFAYIRQQGMNGRLGTVLLASVAHGPHGRTHYPPDHVQEQAALSARPHGLLNLPMPTQALGFRVQGYGLTNWSQMFTPRQLVCLETFSSLVAQVPKWIRDDGGDEDRVLAVTTLLGLCVGKLAHLGTMFNAWRLDSRNGAGQPEAVLGQHTLSMSWDFAETNPFGGSRGDWLQIVETASRALRFVNPDGPPAAVVQQDARNAGEGFRGRCLVITDPPYFSSIGYANLSDLFYPWIRLALGELFPGLLATIATPKSDELIAEPARHENLDAARLYFINGFRETFTSLKAASRSDLPLILIYAYKEQEAENDSRVSTGWEAMLEALIQAGLTIVGTWPIHGTGSSRMRGLNSNALATYVALVCRPRAATSGRVSRRELVDSLRRELAPAISVLQSTAIAPVDLAQAVIGPGMAVFTRYRSVLETDGTEMSVRAALLLINLVLSEVLDQQEGDLDAETRWAIAWFDQYQFNEAPSGEADALARAKVTSIDGLVRAGVITTRAGNTRLVRRGELNPSYDPSNDRRPTVWEAVQHLVKLLLEGSEEQAAHLLAKLPNKDAARDLAYRLYSICERKGWSEEGGAYNVLVASWPEIARLAQRGPQTTGRLPGFAEE